MQPIRYGDAGPAVVEISAILHELRLLDDARRATFDADVADAVRRFQQDRGLSADGAVGPETWRALDAARWRLGSRTLHHAVSAPLAGEDVRELQERLLEIGYDPRRPDGVYGAATARAVAQFQREVGLPPDGSCGPQTMAALHRLGRKVVGGRPQWLRESERLRHAGPNLVGRTIVIDPGHGGPDTGVTAAGHREADLVFDLASRLQGRLAAVGMRVHLTRGPHPAGAVEDLARATLANTLDADLLIALHLDGHRNPAADGVATYHFGATSGATSTVGEHLAGLVQREIVTRTGMRDCGVHGKTWDLLRLTRMPAVRVDVGYLTSPHDAARITDARTRDLIIDAVVAAVQRMYIPTEHDVPTGSIDVRALRAALARAPGS
ncbi:N-acetylmuramoyl-L-alanine amidase [Pilimelia terevasa]|uniref:N-acetylmuramoyl-L-alanine amidase n=1 Tax=Pilimelia terevasa TaxID=53372 RepID=A0A8J3BVQ0_9ACTN|nr:N-acetylmuramoyl-L-alanine amidase [Pilimelia terevasa]GGK41462.1 N-acetylmuramoyl-L-alanine amidase [Pilimelia terevasa]